VWLIENLKTTRYRNGDAIPNEKVDSLWNKLSNHSTGALCNFNNIDRAYFPQVLLTLAVPAKNQVASCNLFDGSVVFKLYASGLTHKK